MIDCPVMTGANSQTCWLQLTVFAKSQQLIKTKPCTNRGEVREHTKLKFPILLVFAKISVFGSWFITSAWIVWYLLWGPQGQGDLGNCANLHYDVYIPCKRTHFIIIEHWWKRKKKKWPQWIFLLPLGTSENVLPGKDFFFPSFFLSRRLETYFQRCKLCPTQCIFEITFLELCLHPAAWFWLFQAVSEFTFCIHLAFRDRQNPLDPNVVR